MTRIWFVKKRNQSFHLVKYSDSSFPQHLLFSNEPSRVEILYLQNYSDLPLYESQNYDLQNPKL